MKRLGRIAVQCAAVMGLAPIGTANAQHAAPPLEILVFDGDGNGLAEAHGRVFNDAHEFSFKTDDNGEAKLSVPNGAYSLEIKFRDELLHSDNLEATEPQSLQYTLPIHRFRLLVSASNGDLLEGAVATLTDAAGQTAELPVNNGRIDGMARAGVTSLQLTWNAQTVPLARFELPRQRSLSVELEVVALDVQVVQKGSGLGFGPVLVAAASPGNAFPGGTWSDHTGLAQLALFAGKTRARATWFDASVEGEAQAPGVVRLEMALATKTIPSPEDGPRAPYVAQLRQPNFQVWANGDPAGGIRLPLPEGKFDVTVFDDNRKPIFRGIASTNRDKAMADIEWRRTTSGAAEDLAERLLQWPRGLWRSPPSAAIQEAEAWRSIVVADNGSLGLLPPGAHVRIPDNALGKTYITTGSALEIQLGVIEMTLPKAERVKILSAERPELSIVEPCAMPRCRIAVPPGRYLVYVPSAVLLPDPVEVAHGQTAFVNARPY